MNVGFCTITSAHYLPQVQILESSLGKFHPESEFHILLCESPEICSQASSLTARNMLSPADIGCDYWLHLAFCFDGAEFSAMLKPFLMETLIKRGYDALIYLDPDFELFGSLDQVAVLLREYNAVLTPRICLPAPNDGKRPTMDDYILAGNYDPGFIGISGNEETREVLRYWQNFMCERLKSTDDGACSPDKNIAALLPSLLEKTIILRDPAYNMAYWNVFQRKLEYDQGTWTTDSGTLKCYHFSGLCFRDPARISTHQDRAAASAGTPLFNLLSGYCAKIPAQSWSVFRNRPYSLSFYDNGEPITLDERSTFLGMDARERAEIGNPFNANALPLNPIRVRCKERLNQGGNANDWLEQFKQMNLCAIRDNAKLAAAIGKYRIAHRPVIGWLLRTMTNYYSKSARRLVKELMECDDSTFIDKIYSSLLGRAPDPVGMKHYARLLKKGVSRTRILDSICKSSEYRSKMKARRL